MRALKPDVIALQEVSKVWWWRDDPSLFLADTFHMQHQRFWVDSKAILLTSGLAILSTYPLQNSTLHLFERNKVWDQKAFMLSKITTPLGNIAVINVHMSSVIGGDVKSTQFAALERSVLDLQKSTTVFVMGDFNEDQNTTLFKQFIQATHAINLYEKFHPQSRTWAGTYGKACNARGSALLDYILIVPQAGENFRFTQGGVLQPEAPYPSDHCPVWADVEKRDR
jgi:endonuclease/exonuclease/phosphatase family metal-dependent hydrolase